MERSTNRPRGRTRLVVLLLAAQLASCGGQPRDDRPELGAGASTVEATDRHWECWPGTDGWVCSDSGRPASARPLPPPDTGPDRGNTLAPPPEPQTPVTIAIDRPPAREPRERAAAADNDPGQPFAGVPDDFLIAQLTAARDPATIDALRRRYRAQADRLHVMPDPGSGLQLLLFGPFPDRAAAQAALDRLAPAPTEEPWLRRVGSLRAESP